MRRRDVLAGVGAAVWPLVARTQEGERVRQHSAPGFASCEFDSATKQLDLLKELEPNLKPIAMLYDPTQPTGLPVVKMRAVAAGSPAEIEI
jgi:hypothetical protein